MEGRDTYPRIPEGGNLELPLPPVSCPCSHKVVITHLWETLLTSVARIGNNNKQLILTSTRLFPQEDKTSWSVTHASNSIGKRTRQTQLFSGHRPPPTSSVATGRPLSMKPLSGFSNLVTVLLAGDAELLKVSASGGTAQQIRRFVFSKTRSSSGTAVNCSTTRVSRSFVKT